MSEMIERVTRAITDKLNGDPSWMGDTSVLARAAIEAMREPTVGLVDAAFAATDADYYIGDKLGYDQIEVCYRAMIDAALRQPTTSS